MVEMMVCPAAGAAARETARTPAIVSAVRSSPPSVNSGNKGLPDGLPTISRAVAFETRRDAVSSAAPITSEKLVLDLVNLGEERVLASSEWSVRA